MKKIVYIAAGVIVASIIAFAVLGQKSDDSMTGMHGSDQKETSSSNATAPAGMNEITISNFAFSPKVMTVKKGTTVTWTNQDTAHHNVAFSSGSLAGTEGKLMAKGESYSMTFNEVGTYDYHCRPHPYMKATIKVEE